MASQRNYQKHENPLIELASLFTSSVKYNNSPEDMGLGRMTDDPEHEDDSEDD